MLASLPSAGVLAAGGRAGQILRKGDRCENLLLLGAQVLRVEGDRLLHRGERHELQEVVLDDVTRGADAVVVSGTATHADVLGHRDLHVVDVVRVPDRLVQLVREAQSQDVLNRLLAEIVVDAEDRIGRERRAQRVVELLRRCEVMAEWLLDDDSSPPFGLVGGVVHEPRCPSAARPRWGSPWAESRGRTRGCPSFRAPRRACRPSREGGGTRRRIAELARDEPDALEQLLPGLLAELGARMILDRLLHHLRRSPRPPNHVARSRPARTRGAADRGWPDRRRRA